MFDKFTLSEEIEVNDQKITVHSITARQRQEFVKLTKEHKDDQMLWMAFFVKHGTKEFRDCEIDELLDLPDYALIEIGNAVAELSGVEKKQKGGAT